MFSSMFKPKVDDPNNSQDLLFAAVKVNDLNMIKFHLKEGVDPNSNGNLFEAKSPEAATLLLEYGADPAMQSGAFPAMPGYYSLYPIVHHFTNKRYSLAFALVNFKPSMMSVNDILNTITILTKHCLIMLEIERDLDRNKPSSFHNELAMMLDAMTKLLDSLCFQLPSRKLVKLKPRLEENFSYLSSILGIDQKSYCSFLEKAMEMASIIFISCVLKSNDDQKSKFAIIPTEVRSQIMSCLIPSFVQGRHNHFDYYQHFRYDSPFQHFMQYNYSSKIDKLLMKTNAFKIIYTILSEIDKYSSHKFLSTLKGLNPLEIIKQIHNNIESYPNGMTAAVWSFALQHNEDFSSHNRKLIMDLVSWRLGKEYTPGFFQNDDHKSSLCMQISNRINELAHIKKISKEDEDGFSIEELIKPQPPQILAREMKW